MWLNPLVGSNSTYEKNDKERTFPWQAKTSLTFRKEKIDICLCHILDVSPKSVWTACPWNKKYVWCIRSYNEEHSNQLVVAAFQRIFSNYIYIYILGTYLSPTLKPKASKTMSFPTITRVIWVPGNFQSITNLLHLGKTSTKKSCL